MRTFDLGIKRGPNLAYSPDSATLAACYSPRRERLKVTRWDLVSNEPPTHSIHAAKSWEVLSTYDEMTSATQDPTPIPNLRQKAGWDRVVFGRTRAPLAPVFAWLVYSYNSTPTSRMKPTRFVHAAVVRGVPGPLDHPPLEVEHDSYTGSANKSVTLDATGKRVAMIDGTRVCIWRVEAGELLVTLKLGRRPPAACGFSVDGRSFAALLQDAVVFFDTATWVEAKTYSWKVGKLRSLAFSPDGATAAVGSDTGKVVVFDLE